MVAGGVFDLDNGSVFARVGLERRIGSRHNIPFAQKGD